MTLLNLAEKMTDTCSKVNNTYNEFGDQVYGVVEADLPCLYRPISNLQQNNYAQQVELDAMFWLRISDSWALGDIILYEAEYYRIERLIEAKRRLVDDSAQFFKAEVQKIRQVS